MTAALQPIISTCPICGARDAPPYVLHPEVVWAKCPCGLIYKQSSAEQAANLSSDNSEHYASRAAHRIAKSRHQILDVLNHVAPGPLLDIGCSMGHTLEAARELRLPTRGLEVHAELARYCQDQGFEVDIGTMAEQPFASGQFQIVMMKHVLEHTPDPRSALQEVQRVLRAGGGLFIAVPNAAYGKAARNPQANRFYRAAELEGGHYIYYTPATLSRLLVEMGFEVVRVNPQLLHRAAPPAAQAAEWALAPLRTLVQGVYSGLALRKEFWLTAIRR